MVLHWTRLSLAVIVTAIAVPASGLLASGPPPVDEATTQQLTVAARTMLQRRSDALIQQIRVSPMPSEVLGVRFSPQMAQNQEEALRKLETSNRAPVEGGPPYTAARTRLKAARVTRVGDRLTLDATEYTEVDYQTPAGRQAVNQVIRRRFEFATQAGQFVLVGERVVDPAASPINDPEQPTPSPHPEPSSTARPTPHPSPASH